MKKYYLLLLFVSLLSCQPKDKFSWNAGWSAPKYYGAAPMLVEYFYKGKSIAGTSANIGADPGWGITSGGYTGGDIYKDVPDSIYVKWLCSVDGFYYEGGRKLPREKMLNLFKEKTIDAHTGAKADYSLIVAGMAPGGNVTIWMQGATTNKEIIKFKVANKGVWMENDQEYQKGEKETAMSKEFINSEANIFRNLHGIPYSVWEKGEKEYNYDIGFSSTKDLDSLFSIAITGLTKDGSYVYSDSKDLLKFNEKHKISPKKLPVQFSIRWISNDKRDWYEAFVVLPQNLPTVLNDFEKKNGINTKIVLTVDQKNENDDSNYGKIFLQSSNEKMEIMKFRLAKFNFKTKTFNVSKYSLPKGFIFPKWEGREKLTSPEIDYWQEK